MQASLCCEDPGVHGGDALEGCLPPSCLAAFFSYLSYISINIITNTCLRSVSKVCLYVVRTYDHVASVWNLRGGLSRDCKLRFLGSPFPLLFTFCWEKPSSWASPHSDPVMFMNKKKSWVYSSWYSLVRHDKFTRKENARDGGQMKECIFPELTRSS